MRVLLLRVRVWCRALSRSAMEAVVNSTSAGADRVCLAFVTGICHVGPQRARYCGFARVRMRKEVTDTHRLRARDKETHDISLGMLQVAGMWCRLWQSARSRDS